MSFELKPGYYEPFFDDHTNGVIDDVFSQQQNQSWEAFTREHRVPELTVFEPASGHQIEVFDMIPEAGYDRTLVYHGAMGDSLDENIVAHLANVSVTLNRAFPGNSTRVISTSNPGRLGNPYGSLPKAARQELKNGDFRPTVDSTLEYLQKAGIEEKIEFGYSFGADKAVAAGNYSELYDQKANHVIAIEPASVHEWSTLDLAKSFFDSGAHLDTYAAATGSAAYMEARKLAGGLPTYIGGLFRPSNIAIMKAIKHGGFEERVDTLLETHPEMSAYIAWGRESELARDQLMLGITRRLMLRYGPSLHFKAYAGLHHAHADDLRVHTATIIDAFKELGIGNQKSAA